MKAAGSHRAVAVLASLAILALGTGVLVGPAAGTSGGGTAETAKKKKCKKKKAGAAKKKKCKKKKKKQQPGPKPAPLVRATLTWSQEGPDFDLWVFDSNGNRGKASSNAIPSTTFSANDTDGLGPETFTDLIYAKPGRNFSFGVCYESGGNNPTTFTLDYVTADGVHHTASEELTGDGQFRTFAGGAPIPATFCQT